MSPGALAAEPSGPWCSGTYADDFAALTARARDFDEHPDAAFSYCTRSRAEYECLSYKSDGAIRHERRSVLAHGTAFAYKRLNGDTLLVTNDHVASWPAVTDAQHPVDGVPAGCKRVSESLTLVDDEQDSYPRDDVPATTLVTDPQLDVAILKAHGELHVLPWKIGHSAALKERNMVEVRGFPLGAFRATSVGKVISAHDHDDQGDWNHDDFVIDALLSAGNSGSPVLAISCATGEYELVGVYHAGYVGGSALNVVIGIDQVRDLMTTLKRAPMTADSSGVPLDGAARGRLAMALGPLHEAFFPFGGQTATVTERADRALVFTLYGKDFPFDARPTLALEDLEVHDAASFGAVGRVWFGTARGLKVPPTGALDTDAQAMLEKLILALRTDAAAHLAFRAAADADSASRQVSDKERKAGRALQRTAAARTDLVQAVVDLAERLGPSTGDRGETLAGVFAEPPSAGAPRPSEVAAAGSSVLEQTRPMKPPGRP